MIDYDIVAIHYLYGGKAHKVVVLSALVLKNEKSVGCHLPDITLSWCCATTTLGNDVVKSPVEQNRMCIILK